MEWSALEQPGVLIPLIGVLGLLVGSFLNVVILRLPRRLEHDWKMQAREFLGQEQSEAVEVPPDLVFKGSHCPHCKHELSPLDNIPLMSFVFLRGRCRYCKTAISWQYPLVELISGIACATIAWKFGFGWPLLAGLAFTWILIAASGIDARTQLLPDQLTLPLLWIGLLISLIPVFIAPADAILGAAIGWLSLWSVFWLFKLMTGKEGMGYGDFKLLAALGAWMGMSALLPIILLSSLIGAVIGSIALFAKGKDKSTPIPFGPFIAAAGWAWFVFGNELLALYGQWFFSP
ncbi:MAG: prepilin peptidase [Xanthomonadales bacterium]|uniref:prepilin peptidase n=1 Tax=Dokdonella sp. TaxID=2291710 RepID=UPI002C159D93|nr:prepilin peptidase [Xanthomonadales bacterium]MBK7211019.1 prepilin peptidase [Xanthomonadales bacterium]HQZ62454.1 A24 family peptidase [Dokdonella sp.]